MVSENLMSAMMRCGTLIALGAFLIASQFTGIARAQDVVRGVNFVHPSLFSVADQNAGLAHLKTAGVHVIRLGIEEDLDNNIDFIKRANAEQIATVLILHGRY